MKKVLITGINGFTGKHLENYLKQRGFDVYGTVVENITKENYFQCDITNKSQISSVIASVMPEYIIHLAAISFVGESNASLIYDVNVIGTENLLEVLVESGYRPKKIILASSATVYGNQNVEVLHENLCPKPINHYGISKLAMEQIAKNYFDNFNIIITRPFNYTGIGQEDHFLIPKIVKHFKENKREIELGNIDVAREFNSIDYVIEIYFKLLMSDVDSTIVNVASGRPIKLLEVIETMQKIAGYEVSIKINPKFVRKNEIPILVGSTERLYTIVGEINQKDFKETLKELYEKI